MGRYAGWIALESAIAGGADVAEVVQIHARDIGTAPDRQLTVAVLTDNKAVNVSRINVKMISQKILKSCGIQNRSRADNSVLWKSRKLLSYVGKNVNGIGYDQYYTLGIIFYDIADNRFKYPDIVPDKIYSCLTGLLRSSCRNDYYICVGQIAIISRVDIHRRQKGKSVIYISSLTLGTFEIEINKNYLGKQMALCQ